ncbi:MAG: hypothetical protein ACREAQ_07775 [Nitrososphaera sp.]
MMSEVDNSTLVESAMEMQTLEEQPESVVVEAAAPETSPTVSNQEAMTALILSRVKRQSKQLENLNKLIGQFPTRFRDLDRRQSKQSRRIELRIGQMQSQVRQLQTRITRLKVGAGGRKRSSRKKARKGKNKKK